MPEAIFLLAASQSLSHPAKGLFIFPVISVLLRKDLERPGKTGEYPAVSPGPEYLFPVRLPRFF